MYSFLKLLNVFFWKIAWKILISTRFFIRVTSHKKKKLKVPFPWKKFATYSNATGRGVCVVWRSKFSISGSNNIVALLFKYRIWLPFDHLRHLRRALLNQHLRLAWSTKAFLVVLSHIIRIIEANRLSYAVLRGYNYNRCAAPRLRFRLGGGTHTQYPCTHAMAKNYHFWPNFTGFLPPSEIIWG